MQLLHDCRARCGLCRTQGTQYLTSEGWQMMWWNSCWPSSKVQHSLCHALLHMLRMCSEQGAAAQHILSWQTLTFI